MALVAAQLGHLCLQRGDVAVETRDVVLRGGDSRAQLSGRQAGGSAAAQGLNLNPTADGGAPEKPAVGGTKLTQPDTAASGVRNS